MKFKHLSIAMLLCISIAQGSNKRPLDAYLSDDKKTIHKPKDNGTEDIYSLTNETYQNGAVYKQADTNKTYVIIGDSLIRLFKGNLTTNNPKKPTFRF